MRNAIVLLLLALALQAAPPKKILPKDTPRYQVIAEWVRVVCAVHILQEKFDTEVASAKSDNDVPIAMIRYNHAMNLELGSSIDRLKRMHVSVPTLAGVPQLLADTFEQRIQYQKELISIKKASLVFTPTPGVDYAKLLGRLPELGAEMDHLDRTFMQNYPQLFYGMIVDMKANSQGMVDHLLITKAERGELIRQIDTAFGENITWNPQMTYNTGAAKATRDLLGGNRRCSDEPWG
jgi:hypothetical protein